jgi:hypothetical protein
MSANELRLLVELRTRLSLDIVDWKVWCLSANVSEAAFVWQEPTGIPVEVPLLKHVLKHVM